MVRQSLQTGGILVIACAMSIYLVSRFVWPTLYLRLHQVEFTQVATDCSSARVSHENALRAQSLQAQQNERLIRSSMVELLKCDDLDVLRSRLLANGVTYPRLLTLELESQIRGGVSLERLVSPYADE